MQNILEIRMKRTSDGRDYKAELKELSDIFARFVKVEKIQTTKEPGMQETLIQIEFEDLPESKFELEQAYYYVTKQDVIAQENMKKRIWEMFNGKEEKNEENQ